jgi:hypothetical protein
LCVRQFVNSSIRKFVISFLHRRDFFKQLTIGCAAAAAVPSRVDAAQAGGDRALWVSLLRRIADPVLNNLANETLKARMPVEEAAGANRGGVTHLEAIGRLAAGMAPWLDLPPDDSEEGRLRAAYAALTRRAIDRAVDPSSKDFLNFSDGARSDNSVGNTPRQPLVDAAFLAQAVLRAPRALRDSLEPSTKRHLVAALESSRAIVPAFSNWLLFSATVEAGLARLGAAWDRTRVDYALRQHDQWYKGDGVYGDGPEFHFDYYNSFVIHPMMVDVLDAVGSETPAWKELAAKEEKRAQRYAAILERLIAPDGSFPPVGRSIAYRCGALQALAQAALRSALPEGVSAAQVRGALTAAIRKSLEAPGTFDANGWLRIGFCGHQPGVGERYISTGSVYLCSVAFLPLGLDPRQEFWSAPPQSWTSKRAWSGQAFPIDHAL